MARQNATGRVQGMRKTLGAQTEGHKKRVRQGPQKARIKNPVYLPILSESDLAGIAPRQSIVSSPSNTTFSKKQCSEINTRQGLSSLFKRMYL